jgi:lysophospholipase L1-like esterase
MNRGKLIILTAAALTAVCLVPVTCVLAQTSLAEPVPSGPAPEVIADPLLRQILAAPQTQKGVVNPAWWQKHERDLQDLAAAKASGPVRLLFVGDSITDNYHGPFKPLWDEVFAPHGAVNLGVGGDSTQHVLWRLDHGEAEGLTPDDIVVLIGTNNTWHDPKATAVEVAEGVKAVVYDLHARMPKAKLLVLAILPTGVSAEKSAKDAEINRLVAEHFAEVSWAKTLDIGNLFLKPDGTVDTSLFSDPRSKPPRSAVHPDKVGQRKMAEAVAAALYGSAGK